MPTSSASSVAISILLLPTAAQVVSAVAFPCVVLAPLLLPFALQAAPCEVPGIAAAAAAAAAAAIAAAPAIERLRRLLAGDIRPGIPHLLGSAAAKSATAAGRLPSRAAAAAALLAASLLLLGLRPAGRG
eukprot:CAMPEP_0183563878 /NCGR_PEP_ID=MMETSP0371-20130417/103438_1 /TAXON_ID=268820 /ORGANISM="Peridinium aciculiferum, Strain PAER-2" /LENGTH=129 /DNA_ID=CAMNT_0025772807 /DNA_START=320 /DNA_END=705 /DNA_ORIENTATION=-